MLYGSVARCQNLVANHHRLYSRNFVPTMAVFHSHPSTWRQLNLARIIAGNCCCSCRASLCFHLNFGSILLVDVLFNFYLSFSGFSLVIIRTYNIVHNISSNCGHLYLCSVEASNKPKHIMGQNSDKTHFQYGDKSTYFTVSNDYDYDYDYDYDL